MRWTRKGENHWSTPLSSLQHGLHCLPYLDHLSTRMSFLCSFCCCCCWCWCCRCCRCCWGRRQRYKSSISPFPANVDLRWSHTQSCRTGWPIKFTSHYPNKYGSLFLKICSKISAQMLVKQISIFYAIYCVIPWRRSWNRQRGVKGFVAARIAVTVKGSQNMRDVIHKAYFSRKTEIFIEFKNGNLNAKFPDFFNFSIIRLRRRSEIEFKNTKL